MYKTDKLEIRGSSYTLNRLNDSNVCYDDLEEYCKSRNIEGIASIETIIELGNDTILEDYQDIFNKVKARYSEYLIFVPLHNLMYYDYREIVDAICVNIEKHTDMDLQKFDPYPFCRHTRYLLFNPRYDTDTYEVLIPMAFKERFIRTINKSKSRYNLIKDFLGSPEFKNVDISNCSIEELKEYAEYLEQHMKDYI